MSDDRQLWIWYTPFGLGGVETFLLGMAREAVAAGARIAIASVHRDDGPLADAFAELGVEHFAWGGFYPAFMKREPRGPIRARILRDLAAFRPTLVALNDCSDFAIGVAPLLRRLRPFATVADTFHIDAPGDDYLEFRRSYLKSLDGIAGTNRRILDRFRNHFGRAASRIETRYVPNGVTVPNGERHRFDGTLRIVYVGRLAQKQKRIFELAPILGSLRDRGIEFEMTIAGQGDDRGELGRRLAAIGVRERVTFAGFVPPDRVPDLLRSHDVFLNVSDYEGFSMSLIEAMACGCIPVITDLPSLDREVLHDGENCRLVPAGEPREAAAILAGLTPEVLDRLGVGAEVSGRTLTTARTFEAYRTFVADLRGKRPLRPWPDQALRAIDVDWDFSKNNPWLARTHPLRTLARAVMGRDDADGRW